MNTVSRAKKIFCTLIVISQLLGCNANSNLLIKKETIKVQDTIDFLTCWGEETAKGKEIKRLVDNFNLSANDELKISLTAIEDREDYLRELHVRVATNNLPDIFILIRNDGDQFLEQSGKLMDFAPYLKQFVYSGLEESLAERNSDDNKLLSLYFEIPIQRIYLRKNITRIDDLQKQIISPSILYKMLDSILNYGSGNLDESTNINSNEAIEFLYYLTMQTHPFSHFNAEEWAFVLEQWKKYLPVLGFYESFDSKEDSDGVLQRLCYIGTSEYFEQNEKNVELFDYLNLTDWDNQIITGNALGWAAIEQNNELYKQQIIDFIEYLLKSDFPRVVSDGRISEEFMKLNPEELRTLDSSNMNPKFLDQMNNSLEKFLKDEITSSDCARSLSSLWQKYSDE